MTTAFCAGTSIRRIVESLPTEEAQHMHRVSILIDILTRRLYGLDIYEQYSDEYKYFGEAAAYHDIGKAWVPKNILIKPGNLTEEETFTIRQHPMFAKELFDQINNGSVPDIARHLVKPAFDSAVYHHEWWNGNGYPYGISSIDIPLIARITSICDAYDAIISDRVYRKAHTHRYACSELEANAGTQFDPTLVRIFLDNDAEFSRCLIKRRPVCE